MIRTGIAILVATLALGWPGSGRDANLNMQMMPVTIAGHALKVSRS